MSTNSTRNSWIVRRQASENARLRLLCFPHAGGGASVFREWPDRLGPDVDVCAVQLPGREQRHREEPFRRLTSLLPECAAAIRELCREPFGLYGHSMGALVAFEMARYLGRVYGLSPKLLLVSGFRAPHLPRRGPELHRLSASDFLAALDERGGIPEAVMANEELMTSLTPTLRADMELFETYEHAEAEPLACPVAVFGGRDDELVSSDELAEWRRHSHGKVSVATYPGGHFFHQSAHDDFMRDVSRALEIEPELGSDVEAALLADASVADCAVLEAPKPPRRIAYVVPATGFSPEHLASVAASKLLPDARPDAYVAVTHIPLSEDGTPDFPALGRLPVVDRELADKWESSLTARAGIEDAAVVIVDAAPEPARPLHLADVLPSALASRHAATVPHVEPSERPGARGSSEGRVEGPAILPRPDAPETVAEAFLRTAAKSGDKGIVHIQSGGVRRQSYADLLAEARCLLTGLRKLGLEPGAKVVLQLESLPDYFATFWACVLGGISPVTVAIAPSYSESNAVVKKLHDVWRLLGEPPILASDDLTGALAGLAEVAGMEGVRVFGVREFRDAEPASDFAETTSSSTVFFQLTSGSTGVSKCIPETNQAIVRHILGSQRMIDLAADDVTLNWLPMDHVVPLLMCHVKDVYFGCDQIQLSTADVLSDPLLWLDRIDEYRVTHTWSPNFGFKLVNDRLARMPDRRWDLSCVRYFTNAGEQVTLPVVGDFLRRLAPHGLAPTSMLPAYGMAELATAITYARDLDLDADIGYYETSSLSGELKPSLAGTPNTTSFVPVGLPLEGVEIRIVDANDEVLPELVIGRVHTRGDNVTPGYFDNPDANAAAFRDGGWIETGDLGFLRDGCLTITGREKELIIVRGTHYHCYDVEDVVGAVAGVDSTSVGSAAVRDHAGEEGLAIFFTPEGDPARSITVAKEVRSRVASQLGVSPAYVVPVPAERFPKTTSGKIQRGKLKSMLESGELDSVCRDVDLAFENERTLPRWFHESFWRPRRLGSAGSTPEGVYVVVADGSLGGQIAKRLADDGQQVVRVESGSRYEEVAVGHYLVPPGASEDYRRVLEAVAEGGAAVRQLVVCLDAAAPDSHARELWGRDDFAELLVLLGWARKLMEAAGDGHVGVTLVTRGAASVHEGDRVAPPRAAAVAFLKSLGQERPELACRAVDVGTDADATAADAVVDELRSAAPERTVAYREGMRFIERLRPLPDDSLEGRNPLFAEGGFYIVTGAMGGVGLECARYLMERYEARLLLVGRTEPSAEGGGARVRDAMKTLSTLSGEFHYRAGDVGDAAFLERAVAECEALWGTTVSGAVHLAGAYHERMVEEETDSGLVSVLDAKANGARVLHDVLARRDGTFVVHFGSVIGWFGGAAVSAYAAANAYLSALARSENLASGVRSYLLAWTPWQGVGMSGRSSHTELTRARGYQLLPPERALQSLEVALRSLEPGEILIGLDDTNRVVARRVEREVASGRRLRAFVVPEPGTEPVDGVDDDVVRDRYGTESLCAITQLAELPRNEAGRVDRASLSGESPSVPTGPMTDLEVELGDVWRDTLAVADVGVDDNFFELGGDSLLAMRLLSSMRERFKVTLSARTVFEKPVLRDMARSIAGADVDEAGDDDDLKSRTAGELLSRIDELSDDQVASLLREMGDGEGREL